MFTPEPSSAVIDPYTPPIEAPQTGRGAGFQRFLTMFALVMAGEAIFGLPFHVPRYFRPTYVDVFGVTQEQLGAMGSLYGIIAMFSYLLGGGLADRFSPRRLLAGSLMITGASGLYLAMLPSETALYGLYAFWGASTILPFWSALIRATRDWGGKDQQGGAFGLLDAGRGLLAAAMATFAVYLFAQLLPDSIEDLPAAEKRTSLQAVILLYTIICFVAAALVWVSLPRHTSSRRTIVSASATGPSDATRLADSPRGHLGQVLRLPVIWFQAVVIIGAYCGFKGVDFYSQYASDIWQWSDVDAAGLSAYSAWMRPIAAIAAGLLADRWLASGTVISAFVLVVVASLSMVLITPASVAAWFLWASILVGCLGIFALRGIYFALLEESKVPLHLTGTAVGVVSFIGYTPEVFMPLLSGYLIDRWNGGITGYQVLFSIVGFAALVGITATVFLKYLCTKQPPAQEIEL